MTFTVIIPARYASQRLPGKVLMDLQGKPMIQRVYEQACRSSASDVVVATDDERVARVVDDFGGQVCMTRADHVSGTDRLQEVVQQQGLAATSIVVNVQGDEPLMPPAVIDQVANNLARSGAEMATLYEPIDRVEDLLDPNVVKVLTDERGLALYFSRAPVPWARDEFAEGVRQLPAGVDYKRHLGIYAYRVGLLHRFVGWLPTALELTEKLEQLRVLGHGESVSIDAACAQIPPGIDTLEDLQRARSHLASADA